MVEEVAELSKDRYDRGKRKYEAGELELRRGVSGYLKNPFTPEEEIVFGDPPPPSSDGPVLYVTGIDLENKTVTLGSEPPVRECVEPGWQATIYNLELPK